MKVWYCCKCEKYWPETYLWGTDTSGGLPVGTHKNGNEDSPTYSDCGGHMILRDVEEAEFENHSHNKDGSFHT